MEKIAIYVRWSTEDQGEGTTLHVQAEACKAFLASQGWPFRAELLFVDDGVSGATLERPALSRLRAAVAAGQVECVVVYKLDRLSRSVLDMLKLVLEEWQDRCHLKSAREPIDTLTPTGRMFFYQLMSFAEWERSVIKERMFAGKLRRAQEGRDPGIAVPYGYCKGPTGAMEIDARTAPVVQRIFQLYRSGLGCRAISRVLHEEGVRSPGGGAWSQASVAQILGNPAYTGTLWYGKKVTRGQKRVKAAEPLVVHRGFFPPLIDEALFQEVQAVKAAKPGVGKGGARALRSAHLLTGLLRCGACGHAMIARQFSKGGARYSYYTCSAVSHAGPHRCSAGSVRQDELDDLVAFEFRHRYHGAGERTAACLAQEREARLREAAAAREAAEAELRRLTENARRLKRQMIDGDLSPAEYRELQAELACQRESATDSLARAAAAERAAERMAAAPPVQDEWAALDPVDRKHLLRQFITSARALKPKEGGALTVEISWRSASLPPSSATPAALRSMPRSAPS